MVVLLSGPPDVDHISGLIGEGRRFSCRLFLARPTGALPNRCPPTGMLLELLAKGFNRRESIGLLRLRPQLIEIVPLVTGALDPLGQLRAGLLRLPVLLEVLLGVFLA